MLGILSGTGHSHVRGSGVLSRTLTRALVPAILGALALAACGDPNDPQAFGSLSGMARDAVSQAPLEGVRLAVAGREGQSTGVVSGTPLGGTGPEGEPIALVLLVRDVVGVGASAFAPVSIGIVPAPVVIAVDLPNGQVGVHYETFLEHSGGFGNFDYYSVIAGAIPPGLSISDPMSLFGSRLLGTPTLAGTYQFTLRLELCATNRREECTPQIATRDYEVVIAGSPLSIVTSTLPDAEVGTPYSVFLVRDGGAGPFTWDVVSGSLPVGITLTADGELTGTPTAPGDASFEVRVQDAGDQTATANLSLHVSP